MNADSCIVTNNLFVYCNANPIAGSDPDGYFFEKLFNNDTVNDSSLSTEGGYGGGYCVDLSMAVNSSLWHSPLLNGEWTGFFVQTPYTYSLDHLTLPQGKTATPEMLKDFATDAANRYISSNHGKGAVYGTKGHTFVESLIKEQNWSNVGVEVSFKGNAPAHYGEKGSVRLDIVLFSSNTKEIPIYAIDLKFGITPLTQRRIDQINEQLPNLIQIDQVP